MVLPVSFDVHHELGLEVTGHDRRDTRLGVVFLLPTVMPRVATIFSGSSVSPFMMVYCGGQ
jgi:hypothetical protein